jgi:1-acyl-sn-glycerol-3-phosphate acyltransferase
MHPVVQRLIHYTAHGLSRPFFLWPYLDTLYHPTIEPGSDRLPKPPFIMVGNHGTFLDPWIIGRRSVRPVYYMCNDDAWRASAVTRSTSTASAPFQRRKVGPISAP